MSEAKRQITSMFGRLNKCTFSLAWIGPCKEESGSHKFCQKHKNTKCSSCGEQATRECSETMGLVCGSYLCDNCEHTICENGCNSGAPLPPGLKTHCKKSEQIYKPWYTK